MQNPKIKFLHCFIRKLISEDSCFVFTQQWLCSVRRVSCRYTIYVMHDIHAWAVDVDTVIEAEHDAVLKTKVGYSSEPFLCVLGYAANWPEFCTQILNLSSAYCSVQASWFLVIADKNSFTKKIGVANSFGKFKIIYQATRSHNFRRQWSPHPLNQTKLNSARELYRPSNHRLSATLVPTFADRWCHVVSVTDPNGRILGFPDLSRYFFFQAAQLYARGWMGPVPEPTTSQKVR
jgi:hypothetical protein